MRNKKQKHCHDLHHNQRAHARTHARTHAPNTHKAYKQKYLPAFAVEDHEKHRIFLWGTAI
jgi:hypothetical protein